MKHVMVNVVAPDHFEGPSEMPTYKAVFAYVLRTYTPEAMRVYLADHLYDAGDVDTDFDMAAMVAYDLSNDVYAAYRDWATGETSDYEMRATIDVLLPGAGWSPTIEMLREAGEVM